MKKLFKEVWKSFSKTKSLIIGLTVLIFLSSGVFTLLTDVKTNYNTQFDDYKKISKIHDLTVDTEIQATGERPSEIYIPVGLQEKTEFLSENTTLDSKKAIRFSKNDIELSSNNEGYIKISKLSILGEETNPNYLKVNDLYRFFQLNNIVNYVDNLTGLVESRNFPSTPLQEYVSPGVLIPTTYSLKLTDKITNFKFLERDIAFGDLVTVVPGVNNLWNSTDDRITNVKSIYINAQTHEATISQSLKQSWEKQGILITITPDQTANLLGFNKDMSEGKGSIYKIDPTLVQNGIFEITPPVGNDKWRLEQYLNQTIKPTGFSINLNQTIMNDIEINNVNQFFVLSSNFTISQNWMVREKISYEYERYHTKINFDFLNANAEVNKQWTKNYKDYMLTLNAEKQKYYSQTSFWKKTQIIEIVEDDGVTVIDPTETIRISQPITSSDLNKTLIPKDDVKIYGPRSPSSLSLNVNSILWIERESNFISQTDVDLILKDPNGSTSVEVTQILNNSNSKNQRIQEIDNGAKAIAQKALYEEILSLVGDIQNIGLRENITVSGFLDDVANTFHFINAGNMNQEIQLNDDILIEQNVGKLYNEEQEKSLLFELSSEENIMSSKVPQSYIFSILDLIFSGMSVDKNYINPIITFEYYEYIPYNNSLKTNSNISSKMQNAKIVRMQDYAGNIFGISRQAPKMNETNGKYYILIEKVVDGKKGWIADQPQNFDGSEEDLKEFIKSKDLNFADTTADGNLRKIVGPNGWAKQNPNYQNKYSIPFQILIPQSEIINNWEESNNFNVFRDNLINSLTTILEPLISAKNLKILIESTTTSLTKHGFADVLTFPSKIENRKLQKIIFGVFYEAAKYDDNLFWNEFLDEIFSQIILNSNSNPDYIQEEIQKIGDLLKLMLGNEFDITAIISFVNDPYEMILGLRKIIASIDIDKSIINIWERFYDVELDNYRVIGTGDILPILLNNISAIDFKTGLKQIVSQINFSELITYLKENVMDEETLELFGPILEQLNGNLGVTNPNPNDDYININNGFNKIIDLIDINALSLTISKNSKIRSYYVENEDGEQQEYKINSISISELSAALLDSLGKNNDNDDALHNAMIEMLNISSKTEFIGVVGIGVYQPASDPNKLDIRDFQSLLKSPTPQLDDLETSLQTLSKDLENSDFFLDPDSTVGQYLTNYIFDFKNDISITNEDIKKRVDIYLNFMNETKFINFDPNIPPEKEDGVLGNNIGDPVSLADKFINMIHPNTRPQLSNFFLNTTMTQTYNEFYNANNPLQSRDMTSEILNFYSFWMKFSELNLNSTSNSNITTTQDVANQINILVTNTLDQNSEIGKILNTASQSFNPTALLGTVNFQILDGFSNAKETAIKLSNLSEEILIQNGLSKDVLNYYFDYENGKLTINNNTIALVSALTSIISIDNPADNRSKLITIDFINLFLPSDKETANIMLTLGQRTLNTLLGPTNTIMESLGISSVIVSPFTAVLNSPALLWFTVNQSATSETDSGNLLYILKNRLYKLNSSIDQTGIDYSGFEDILNLFIGEDQYMDNPTNMDELITLSLDIDYLNYLNEEILGNSIIFGINASEALLAAVGSFTETRTDDYQIVISDIGSYLAKVNDAYLISNNKSVYKMTIEDAPKDSIEMQELMKQLDDKYKINVNGLEFLIIGADSTVDYLYPVTDFNNIQVDTKTQALVYVNQLGFDRVKESNANAPINKYFLLIAPSDLSPTILRDKINEYIYTSTTGLNNYNDLTNQEKNNAAYKKAFLYNESNPLKPEISLRVETIEILISSINQVNIFISVILLFLIGTITIFVIKRYITSRSKVLGILKAQGYKTIQIAISICLFALIIALFGATLGYVVGHLLQIPVMNIFSIYWTLPIGPLSFNVVSLIITVLVPLIGLILLTIITTLFLLRVKPTKLMNGSFELNNSKIAEVVKTQFHSRNIKSKFTLSLSLNSIWKLISLLVSLLLTVTIMSFSFASKNAFGNAVTKTYKNRNYNYKIELISPTLEGGAITTFSNQDVNNLLYVPIGNPNEGAVYLGDYFAPGPNQVINPNDPSNSFFPNGQPLENDKHIVTKSSFDLTVDSGGIATNVWISLFNAIPDSQKSKLVEISDEASQWLEWTQDLTNYGQSDEAKIDEFGVKQPYFKYLKDSTNPENSKFVYRNINEITNDYFYQDIIISGDNPGLREKYRDFLVQAYNKSLNYIPESNLNEPKFVQDYFLTFGSIVFNEKDNEKYSYANTINKNDESHMPTINGFSKTSEQIKIIDKNNNDLLEKASAYWSESKEVVPVIINHVVKDKRNLDIGSQLELTVLNTTNRFTESIKETFNDLGAPIGTARKTTWTFEVIGINETFINEEWITTQKIINEITYLDDPRLPGGNEETPFNGILSREESPRQATDSLGLYSESGYWSAEEKIDLVSTDISQEQQIKNTNIFKELFYKVDASNINNSVFAKTLRIINPNILHDEESSLIKLFLEIDNNISLSEVLNPGNEIIINNSLAKFVEIYNSNNVLTESFMGVQSKNIESGFIANTTESINSVSTIVIVLSLLMSVTILIMISTLIISENERNAAIFSVLGYNNKEKIVLFFSLYIPIIILSILFSIPLSMSLISMFTTLVNSSISISLSISLSALDVLFSSLIVSFIFSSTTLIAWWNLNKIKPIMLLKGE